MTSFCTQSSLTLTVHFRYSIVFRIYDRFILFYYKYNWGPHGLLYVSVFFEVFPTMKNLAVPSIAIISRLDVFW